MKLDVVMPIYNPVAGWAEIMCLQLRELTELFGQMKMAELHFILVNDGSKKSLISETDIAQIHKFFPQLEYLSYEQNQGKGYALRYGVAAADGDYVIYSDYDFPFGVQSIWNVFQLLHAGADIVAALRDQTYSDALNCDKRRNITSFVRSVNRVLLRLKDHDAQAGLKGFNHRGRAVFLRTQIRSFLFDTEFIAMASSIGGMNIQDMPVSIAPGIVMSKKSFRVLLREGLHLGVLVLRALGKFKIALRGIQNELK